MGKYKVEITGIDTNKLKVLKNNETIELFKKYQKGAYFYDLTNQSSVFFHLPFVRLQADFRIQRRDG